MIWDLFIADPTTNSVRKLAERFGLSLKRIDAILRLKGLEQHWIKVCCVFCYLVPPSFVMSINRLVFKTNHNGYNRITCMAF